ncbi:MAG: peptide chain release factor N(5)-glutamine methyltransferase, partial [Caldiserica bacterium]|nr:peptide chain release factor N(5)-glutamine methyltransferase [Caldisericota bacterium]
IMGVVEFCGLEFRVKEGAFTPRQDTEVLVEFAREVLPDRKGRILDLCCGVGNIGLSLAYLNGVDVVGVDILSRSIELSNENAVRLGVREKAEFIKGDMFSFLEEVSDKFSLIVSNPPYIPEEDKPLLPLEVINEPEVCWNGGERGMKFYPGIIYEGIEKISSPGYIILEVGEQQAEEVRKLMEKAGLKETGVKRDSGHRERMVWGKKT